MRALSFALLCLLVSGCDGGGGGGGKSRHLAFLSQPADTLALEPIPAFQVGLLDDAGEPVDAGVELSLELEQTGEGQQVIGATEQVGTAGVATFEGLFVTLPCANCSFRVHAFDGDRNYDTPS